MTPGWNPTDLPILALAFVGDAIWHIYVRDHVIMHGIRKPNDLHRAATRYVRAEAQAAALEGLMGELTPAEQAVAKRGRNAKTSRGAKHADVLAYRHSTGFEALLGHVYGTGQTERLSDLCGRALRILDEESEGYYATKPKNGIPHSHPEREN